jgi:hypothetical protein
MADKSLQNRETVRRTLEMTKQASDNLSKVSKSLGISQPALVSEIFESLRSDDPQLNAHADKYRDAAEVTKRKHSALLKKLEKVDPAKLDELLRNLESE